MNNNRRIARLEQILEVLQDEILEHVRMESLAKEPTAAHYHRGYREALTSVVNRVREYLDLDC